MKLTESRINEIIQEEVDKAQTEQNNAKTMQEFKKFLVNLAKQSHEVKGASTEELQALVQHILKILRTLGKGEVSTYIQKADELFANKTGNK